MFQFGLGLHNLKHHSLYDMDTDCQSYRNSFISDLIYIFARDNIQLMNVVSILFWIIFNYLIE